MGPNYANPTSSHAALAGEGKLRDFMQDGVVLAGNSGNAVAQVFDLISGSGSGTGPDLVEAGSGSQVVPVLTERIGSARRAVRVSGGSAVIVSGRSRPVPHSRTLPLLPARV